MPDALSIYLAGTSFHSEWRYPIVNGLRAHPSDPVDEWPVLRESIFKRFDFVGPFTELEDPTDDPDNWLELRIDAIRRADVVFAWLEVPADRLDGVFELGIAKALGKRILIGGPDYGPEEECLFRACANGDERAGHIAYDLVNDWPWLPFKGAAGCLYLDMSVLGLLCESPVEQMFFDEASARDGYVGAIYSQIPFGRSRLDFCYPRRRLAIEIDGHEYHKTKEQRSRDAKKDRELGNDGWRVIRFTGSDVYRDVKGCVDEVGSIVESMRPVVMC